MDSCISYPLCCLWFLLLLHIPQRLLLTPDVFLNLEWNPGVTPFYSSVSAFSGTVVSACADSTVAVMDSLPDVVFCLPQEAKDKIHTVIKVKIVVFSWVNGIVPQKGNNAITFIMCDAHDRGTRLYWLGFRWGGGTGGFGEPGR